MIETELMKVRAPQTGLFLRDEAPRIASIDRKEGKEGTILTLKGRGFAKHTRNNCIVVGGMGACARAEPGSSDSEIRVKIGPVPRVSAGDISVWMGIGSDFYHEAVSYNDVGLSFSETAIFRNGTPIAQAGVEFKLTEASPHTYGASLEKVADAHMSLCGHEQEHVLAVRVPRELNVPSGSQIDLCLVLKEHPTLAVDFTATIEGRSPSTENILRAVAKSIMIDGHNVGQAIFADVAAYKEDYVLYVTKPYLETGMLILRFAM